MTTDFARKQASRPSSTQDGQERQTGIEIQVPVLIRLPDLSELADARQASPETCVVSQNSPPLHEAPSDSEEDQAEMAPDSQRLAEDSASCETTKARTLESAKLQFLSAWSDFRLPSSVVHAAVALSLIAVFVVAYMVIVGGGGESTELAKSKPAAGDKKPPTATHTESERLDMELDAFLPKIPQTPRPSPASPAAGKPRAADPAGKPAGKPAAKPAAKPAVKPAGNSAAKPAGKPAAQKAKKPPANQANAQKLAEQKTTAPKANAQPKPPVIAAKSKASATQETDFESLAASLQMQAKPSASDTRETENRWSPGFSNEIPRERNASATAADGGFYRRPLTSQPPVVDANRFANPTAYPSTNPASFQYPADYHQHLIGTNSSDLNRPSPWSDETRTNGQPPSTARLQPRMDAPPIR